MMNTIYQYLAFVIDSVFTDTNQMSSSKPILIQLPSEVDIHEMVVAASVMYPGLIFGTITKELFRKPTDADIIFIPRFSDNQKRSLSYVWFSYVFYFDKSGSLFTIKDCMRPCFDSVYRSVPERIAR